MTTFLIKRLSVGSALAMMIALGSSTLTASSSTSFFYTITALKALPGDIDSRILDLEEEVYCSLLKW